MYIFTGLALFYSIKRLFNKQEIERIILLFLALFMLIGGAQSLKMISYPQFSIFSYFLNANFFAGFLILCLPLVLKKRIIPWGIIYTMICAFTHSRGLYLSLIAGFIIHYAIKRSKKTIFLIVFFLMIVLLLPGAREKVKQGISEKNYRIDRITIWKEALRQYSQKPISGNGWGSFPSIFLSRFPLIKLHAHSLYMEILSSFGLSGILIFLIILMFSLYRIIPDIRSDGLIMMLPFMIFQIFTNSFYSYKLTLLFFLIIAWIYSENMGPENKFITLWEIDMIKFFPFFLIFAAIDLPLITSFSGLLFLLIFRFLSFKKFNNIGKILIIMSSILLIRSMLHEIGVYKYNNKEYKSASEFFNLENIMIPANPIAFFYEGNSLFFLKDKADAINRYNMGLKIYPYYDFFKANFEIISGKKKDFSVLHPETNALLAIYHKKYGDIDGAKRLILKAADKNVLWLFIHGFEDELNEYIMENIFSINLKLKSTPDSTNELLLLSYFFLMNNDVIKAQKMALTAQLYAENSFQRMIAKNLFDKTIGKKEILKDNFELSDDFSERVFSERGVFQSGVLRVQF